MKIISIGNFFKVLNSGWLYIHEITYYNNHSGGVAAIVTGASSTFKNDAKTNVDRYVYSEEEFLDLRIEEVEE